MKLFWRTERDKAHRRAVNATIRSIQDRIYTVSTNGYFSTTYTIRKPTEISILSLPEKDVDNIKEILSKPPYGYKVTIIDRNFIIEWA
jgi:hypothetical protein